MRQRAGTPPGSRRSYSKGVGGVSIKKLGAAVYRSPLLKFKRTPSQAQIYAQKTLSIAAVFTRQITTWEKETCTEIAAQSGYTWRDQFYASLFGTGMEVTDVNGVVWYSRRELALNIQQLLDSLSTEPGSLLVRTDSGWACLFPAGTGYVLTLNASTGLPDWEAPTGGGDSGVQSRTPLQVNIGANFTQDHNYCQLSPCIMPDKTSCNAIQFIAHSASTTTTVQPCIYSASGLVPGALLRSGPVITGVIAGLNTLPLDSVCDFVGDTIIFPGVLVQVADFSAVGNASAPIFWFAESGALPGTAPTSTANVGGSNLASWPTTV